MVLVAPSLGVTTDWAGQARPRVPSLPPCAPAVVSQGLLDSPVLRAVSLVGSESGRGESSTSSTSMVSQCAVAWCGDIVTVITLSSPSLLLPGIPTNI